MNFRIALVVVLGCSRAQPPAVTSSTSAPTAVVATPAPYDLDADRARIESLARGELGEGTSVQTAQGVFVLVAAPGWNARALAASTDLTTRAIDAYFNGRFDKKPERAITVYLFPEAQELSGLLPRAPRRRVRIAVRHVSPDVRRMVMNAGLGLGTLTHELVHPLVETDFPHAPDVAQRGHRVALRGAGHPAHRRDPRREELAPPAPR